MAFVQNAKIEIEVVRIKNTFSLARATKMVGLKSFIYIYIYR